MGTGIEAGAGPPKGLGRRPATVYMPEAYQQLWAPGSIPRGCHDKTCQCACLTHGTRELVSFYGVLRRNLEAAGTHSLTGTDQPRNGASRNGGKNGCTCTLGCPPPRPPGLILGVERAPACQCLGPMAWACCRPSVSVLRASFLSSSSTDGGEPRKYGILQVGLANGMDAICLGSVDFPSESQRRTPTT